MKKLPYLVFLLFVAILQPIVAQRLMEKLDRSPVAVRTDASNVYVSWRLLGTDPDGIGFNIYRGATLVNATPITTATNIVDAVATDETYTVKSVIGGVEQNDAKSTTVLSTGYFDIPLTAPAGGTTPPYTVSNNGTTESYPSGQAYTYDANDCSVGDLDGDGEYEIVLKWDPTNSRDNSLRGYTGNVFIDAYKLNGTRLWRMDLGINIRAGAHYTQFQVQDFDGDGKAEVVLRTSDGSKDGQGKVIGDDTKDYRSTGSNAGLILTGNEFLTVFEGATGKALTSIAYEPARGSVSAWGDTYGNRSDRFLACTAYLDGIHPSIVMCRGYYTRSYLAAYDFKNNTLTKRWAFDSSATGNSAYAGQGNHNLTVTDVDFDGKDEIIYGACAIDDNGTGLYSTGLGHGDAIHVSDMDPNRPGLEVYQCHEEAAGYKVAGSEFRDARTGYLIKGVPSTVDNGRAMAGDIDPTHLGYEMWSSQSGGIWGIDGTLITTSKPSTNFRIYWDADQLDEPLDDISIKKWIPSSTLLTAADCASNNSTKKTPCLSADIIGDWREELVLRKADNTALRVFTTSIPTTVKMYTLMHDPQYRNAIAWQNTAYNQPPHLGFYFADGYSIPKPNIIEVGKTVMSYALSVTNVGKGFVTTASPGVSYPAGTLVTLTANPDAGINFLGWSGDVTSTEKVITVTMDAAKTLTATFEAPPPPSNWIEAETATVDAAQGVLEAKNANYTGTGYVNLINASGTYFDLTFNVATASNYTINVYFANGGTAARPVTFTLDGTNVATLPGAVTGGWTIWKTDSYTTDLTAGTHTVRFTSTTADGASNIDKIELINNSTITILSTDFNNASFYASVNEGVVLLNYSVDRTVSAQVTLSDISGRLLENKTINLFSDANSVAISDKKLNSGIYLVTVACEGAKYSFKLMVN